MKRIISLILCIACSSSFADDFDRNQIKQRIKPVGQVNIEGQAQVEPEKKEVAVVKKTEPGQQTYEQFCAVCHRAGVAGAPKFRDEAAWKTRMDKKDLAQLTASAIKGINAMPAKGTCMQCSDDEIKAAVQYMLPKK